MRTLFVTLFSVILLLTATCVLFFPPNVAAEDEYIFGVNIKINDDMGSTIQGVPDVAVTGNGIIGIVWMDARVDTQGNDIYFSRSMDGGHTFGDDIEDTDIMINDDTNQASQKSPAIATYNNDIYVVWTDSRLGYEHIYFSKSTDGGSTFSNNIQVDNTATNVNVEFPSIAVTSSGTICVVWQDSRSGDFDIYYAESTNGGTSFSSIRVDSTGAGSSEQKYPKIAIGGNDDKHVVWQDNRDGDYNIYFAHASPGTPTTGFDTDVAVDTDTSEQTRPTIGAYGTSNVYIAWRDKRNTPAGDIYFAKSTDKGSNFNTIGRVDDTSTSTPYQDFPDLTVDTAGNINIVWMDKRGNIPKIYYANSTDAGSNFNENLRVDDTGTNNVEKNYPTIASRGPKNFYISWQDRRDGNDNIYFSRWGKASEMLGYAPTLDSGGVKNPTTGEQVAIAGVQDDLKFTVTYTDIENDASAEGYPKIYIFKDHSEKNLLGQFTMTPQLDNDGDYTNGEKYYYKTKLTEEHDYAYLFEAKAASGNLTLVRSGLQFGPRVDNTLPTFLDPSPESNIWHNTLSMNCSILISDQGGSGVEQFSISYQLRSNGSSEYSRWYTNIDRTKVGQDYRCTAMVSFSDGAENFIRWNATDQIGKKYGWYNVSNPYEVKVDTIPVTFTNPVPSDVYWQNTKSLMCSITINDIGGSGVDASSIKYFYRPSNEIIWSGPFSAVVTQNADSITVSTPTEASFENGEDNYIKWQASDIAGNLAISEEFQIKIDDTRPTNTPPEAPTWVKPENTKNPTPFIEWGPGYDADNDELRYYIQIGTTEYADDVLKWTYTAKNKYYSVNTSLIVGTYYVQIKTFDGLDNSSIFQHTLNITATGADPPQPPNAIYPNVTSDHQPKIYWTMPRGIDGKQLRYLIRIGTSSGTEDILPWTMVESGKMEYEIQLTDGIYYVQLMSKNENGTSFSYEEILRIATFNPILKVDRDIVAKQGESTAAKIILTNNCSVEDSITIEISGELASKQTVILSITPQSPIFLQPGESKDITLLIKLPMQISTGQYSLDIQAISEDGKSKSLTQTLILTVKRADSGPPADGDGGDGKEDTGVGNIMDYLWLIILIIIIIVVIGVVASAAGKKKRRTKEREEFFRKEDEYAKLYGSRKGGRGGPPGAGSEGGSEYDYLYDDLK